VGQNTTFVAFLAFNQILRYVDALNWVVVLRSASIPHSLVWLSRLDFKQGNLEWCGKVSVFLVHG
jgi:hypothetical protein